MGAQNNAISESLFNYSIGTGLHPQTKRPFRGCIILRLDSTQPAHNIVDFLKCLMGYKLVMKSLMRNFTVRHN